MTSVTRADGTSSFTFAVPYLLAGGCGSGVAVCVDEKVDLIVAFGKGDEFGEIHKKAISLEVDVETGKVTVQGGLKPRLIAHGALMGAAWLLLAPAGALLARFGKAFALWFKVHMSIQLSATLLTVAAFPLAFLARGDNHYGADHD